MEILKLTFSDFKCFRGSHTLDFREFGPGLYYLAGKNYLDKDLGQNGAGKSTIWDALHWGLFGTSLRGTKTTQLIPWAKSGKPIVQILMKHNGKIIKLTRSYKPNKITLRTRQSRKDVGQEQLEDLLGLTSETFRHSVVIDQFSRMFFELRAREKLDVFTELLNLDYWVDKSSEASGVLKEVRQDQQDLENKLSSLRGRRKEIRFSLEQLEKEQSGLAESDECQKLAKESATCQKKLFKTQAKVENLKKKLKKKQKNDKVLAKEIGELSVKYTDHIKEFQKHNSKFAWMRNKVDTEGALLIDLTNSTSDVCPSCGQTITANHKRKEVRKIKDRLMDIKTQLKPIAKRHRKLETEIDEINKRQKELQNQLEKERSYKTTHELGSVEKDIVELESSISRNNDKIGDIERSEWQCQEKVDALTKRLEKNLRVIKKVKKALEEVQVTVNQVGYWVRGFKDIRLFEIMDALQSLQVEVNSYLSDLGMARWTVNMEVEKETKKGNISKGLNIMVDPGAGSDTGVKPWEAWSGGEGQRLTLAGTLALSQMILRYLNTSSNIQVWDEKLYWLSGTGEAAMLELLQEIAKREGRQIWLIDQHNLDFPFDDIVTVVKDKNGSRIEL